MKHFTKICDGIDVGPLREQLAAHPELWNVHSTRMNLPGSPFRKTDDLWIRYNDISKAKPDLSGFNDEHIPIWYPAWDALPALRPIVFDLMARVQGEMLGGVLITRVPDGADIKPHVDSSWHVDYFQKFYVAIESEVGSAFCCQVDGETECITPKPGSVWHFDNRKLHWVVNRSGKAKVTLIVCIRTEMFERQEERVPFLGDLPQQPQSEQLVA